MNADLLPLAAMIVLAALSALVLLKESRPGRVPLAVGLFLLALLEPLGSGVALAGDYQSRAGRLVLVLTSLIPPLFLLYGSLFTGRKEGESHALASVTLFAISSIFTLTALLLPLEHFYAGADSAAGGGELGVVGKWFHLGLTVFSLAAIVNLRSAYAGASGVERRRTKYEFLGVGAILAVMVLDFSQRLLTEAVGVGLLPLRSAAVMLAALLVAYSRLYLGRSADLAISRWALYRSFMIVAVILFLLLLGFVFEGTKRLHDPPARHFSGFVALIVGLAFILLLASPELRRRLKVTIAKHFYAQKYDYRVEWLGFSAALAGCRSSREVQAAIVDRYRKIFGLRFAALYVRGPAREAFEFAAAGGRTGMPGEIRPSPGLIGYFSGTGRVMDAADGEYAPSVEEQAFLDAAAAWLLVPLIVGDQLEALVVFGPQAAPERLTYEDFDLMKIIGRQAALSLNNFRLTEELAEAREMAAVAKVSSFVLHDLKNLSYTFSLMLENAEEHMVKPEFQRDLVQSLRGTVAKTNALIAKLKAFPGKMQLRREQVDLGHLAGEVLAEVRGLKHSIAFEEDLGEAGAAVDAQEIRKVVLNLLLNACDAVRERGVVQVRTHRDAGEVTLVVGDNGAGMPDAFMQSHLFKPFRTTKEKGLGIGLFQCKQIVEAHGGRIEVRSREGEGTVFTVVLPAGEGVAGA